ncbi:TPA: HPr(Ser) kinase/phosphatase [Candidatus Poribacteria bacterium]|nr:HPr(Ser) kinase/phosphatase [Candidatus Poribacteria bacterium]HIA65841.1 HPr(Ser) kinase/phosphatase [Candidatus Poribacteria bacterium]HIB90400.1 HPr(Ser) kinase/phosphatase [Candidatus Poribacteria bacterium]HIB98142.1 HPr(Ser) kinase/phosphatase [Candidatus Poribacteria bacterium]HIM12690.1 HPr(Ser) kinase/phosphatase [Candidatus Poribacteria bacterium]
MAHHITVQDLIGYASEDLKLDLIAGEEGLNRQIISADSNRPGLALCGYYDHFGSDRVQIFGKGEVAYIEELSSSDQFEVLSQFFSYTIPCLIFVSDLCVSELIKTLAGQYQVPVLSTPLTSTIFTVRLLHFLEDELGSADCVHGNLVDVFGIGVLILGKSGIGKSECSLELIQKGHRLIADDSVLLKQVAGPRVLGMRSRLFKHYIEVRGLGIIDVVSLFGVTAVGDRKQVELVVFLEEWNENRGYDRTGFSNESYVFHETDIDQVTIPVAPGRNISNLIETAAANLLSQKFGIDAPKNLNSELNDTLSNKKNTA